MESVLHDGSGVGESEPVTQRIVSAIAEREGTDPMELDPPLYRVVDADALERLVGSNLTGHVTFAYLEYDVTVHRDTDVTVTVERR